MARKCSNKIVQKSILCVIFFIILFPINSNSKPVVSQTKSNVGLVIDLDESSPYKHPDDSMNVTLDPYSIVTKETFTDFNQDGFKDMILFINNYEDNYVVVRSKSIWICNFPFTEGNKIIKYLFDNGSINYDLIYYYNNSFPDLLIYTKQSVEMHKWNKSLKNWSDLRTKINIDQSVNGTVTNVQSLDMNGDSFNDLVVFKEYSFVDDKNITHSRSDVLIMDSKKDESGDHGEEIFDTRIVGQWDITEIQYPLRFFNDGVTRSIFVNNRLHRPEGYTDPIGRVYTINNIDFNEKIFEIEGNITREIVDLRMIGYYADAEPINHNGRDDLKIQDSIFPGNKFIGSIFGLKKEDCRYITGAFKTSYGDFNGDGREDLFNRYYDNHRYFVMIGLKENLYAGHLKITDVQDIAIRDSNMSRLIWNFYTEEINDDDKIDVIVCTREMTGINKSYKIFTIHGQDFGRPVISRLVALNENVSRGTILKMEIFGEDPQNYPKYINYDIMIRIGDGTWFTPEITKIEDNWTSEKPFEGSRIYSIAISKGNISGSIDVKVQGTNTFGLRSDWFNQDDIARVVNENPVLYGLGYYPFDLTMEEKLGIWGFVLDGDDDGPFTFVVDMINNSGRTRIFEDTNFSKGEFEINCVIPENLEAGISYLINVSVEDPMGGTGSEENVYIYLSPVKPYFEMIRCSIGVYRGRSLEIEYDLVSGMRSNTLRIWSPSVLDSVMDIEAGSSKKINLIVPLNSTLGDHSFLYSMHDGFSYVNGSFKAVINNNLPQIDLPEILYVNGSETLDMSGGMEDIEDGEDLRVTWNGGEGIAISYNETSKIMSFSSDFDGNCTVKVRVEDKDGGYAEDTMRIVSSKDRSVSVDIIVKGVGGEPIQGAIVDIERGEDIVASDRTGTDGRISFGKMEAGPYTIRVGVPEELSFVEGVQAGYLGGEVQIKLNGQEIAIDLEWIDLEKDTVLEVNVFNEDGSGVSGALIMIDGKNDHSMTTDRNGTAIIYSIMPGDYDLTVSISERIIARESVHLTLGEKRVLNFTLEEEKDEKSEKEEKFPIYPITAFFLVLWIGVFFIIVMVRRKRNQMRGEE